MQVRHAVGSAVGTALIALSGPGFAAEGLSYTYGELSFVTRDIDVFDEEEDFIEDFDDGSGFALRGSFAVADNFFIFGGYSDTESDVSFVSPNVFPITSEEDMKQFHLGAGYNREISDSVDFVGRLAYTDIDFGDFELGADTSDLSDLRDDSSDGFFVDLGVRSQMLENLEGGIGVRYLDIEDTDNTSLVANLMFELSENWGINAEIDAGDDLSTFMLGVRWIGGER